MKIQANVFQISSVDFIKAMKNENNDDYNKMAYTMALDHLLRGAMDGADNRSYMDATLYCYKIMKELIDEKYSETETE